MKVLQASMVGMEHKLDNLTTKIKQVCAILIVGSWRTQVFKDCELKKLLALAYKHLKFPIIHDIPLN